MKRHLAPFVLAITFLTAPAAFGQVRPLVDVHFITGFPTGSFGTNVDGVGFGASIFGGLSFANAPVLLGAELGGMIYGRERRKEAFSPDIPEVTVDVVTNNNILLGHLVLRLQPQSGKVRPYADFLVGLKYLFTETSVRDEGRADDRVVASSTNFDDTAFSYGGGGGLDILLYDGPMGESKRHGSFFITAGARYLLGSEADYLREGPVYDADGNMNTSRSRTDLLVPQLGVRLRF